MSTMTMTRPFFAIGIDNDEKSSQNYSIDLPNSAYTTINTANNLKMYKDTVKDLLYKLLNDMLKNAHSSINTQTLGESMDKTYYTKNKIFYNDTTFVFNIEFIYEVYKDVSENLYIAQNEFFDICGYGDTINEAEQDLYNTLYELWEIYAEENDDNLDSKAKQIKEKLITNVRKLN